MTAAAKKASAAGKPAAKKPAVARSPRLSAKDGGSSMPAKLIAHEILVAKGEPMNVTELARLVVADARASLKGKTPAATVAAHIYVAAKKGDLFKKTGRGTVEALPAPAGS